jgi:hypothetical protein
MGLYKNAVPIVHGVFSFPVFSHGIDAMVKTCFFWGVVITASIRIPNIVGNANTGLINLPPPRR